MARVINGTDVGLEVCKALGLMDQMVKSVIIRIETDDVVRIEVTHLMSDEQSIMLLEVLKKYHLEEDGKNETT